MQELAWLIVWLPLLGFLFNAFLGKKMGKTVVAWVAPGVVLAAFVVSLGVLQAVQSAPEQRLIVPLIPSFLGGSVDTPWIHFGGFRVNFALLLDPLSMLMALIVTGVGGLIHIYATGYMADDPEQPRFFTYFNLFISFWYTNTDNAQAGNKAFIVNRVGDLGFALGMMAIWSVFGTLSFFTNDHKGVMDLAKAGVDVTGSPLANLNPIFGMSAITGICILLFIGATGKSAQIPLWVWLPDAMAGPTPVSALIHAATMVTAGVVMVTRCSWLFVQSTTALEVVAWIGVLTAFLGATIGLVQNDIKRVLAFSTISQLGYMFLACGVGNFTAGMFHVTTHAFFKALLFLGAGAVIHSLLGEQDMRKMGGLRYKIPKTWLVMITGTYAIAGIPPLSGFWSKDEILHSAANEPWGGGSSVGLVLWLIGVVTAFMTAFYMNRLMWKTFYTEPRYNEDELVAHPHHNFADEHEGHDTMVGHEEETTGQAAHHDQLEHGATRIHESPPSMMIPLFILAILSVVAGGLLGPTGYFERFLEPSVAPLSLGGLEEGHGPITPVIGYVVSTLIAIAGVALAAMLYRQHMKTGNLIPEERKVQLERNPLSPYTFLLNKWWWDWLYNTIFITIGGWLATNILWKVIDVGIVDGLFVKGLA